MSDRLRKVPTKVYAPGKYFYTKLDAKFGYSVGIIIVYDRIDNFRCVRILKSKGKKPTGKTLIVNSNFTLFHYDVQKHKDSLEIITFGGRA